MSLGGAGLLFARTSPIATRILLPYLLLWTLLRIPALVMAPLVEVNWFAVGETAVLFASSLLAFGLSHFIYNRETVAFVPAWLPFHGGWAYLTGAGHIAAGLGVLLSIYPRLAATTEAAMLTIFTVLVWIPRIIGASATRNDWGEFVISWAIAAGAWVVAGSMARRSGAPPRAQAD